MTAMTRGHRMSRHRSHRPRRLTTGQWVGLTFLLAAAVLLGRDVLVGWTTAQSVPTSFGELWHSVSPASLNLAQAVIQRYLHPVLWTEVVQPLLLVPAAAVFGGIGVVALVPSALRRLRNGGAQQ